MCVEVMEVLTAQFIRAATQSTHLPHLHATQYLCILWCHIFSSLTEVHSGQKWKWMNVVKTKTLEHDIATFNTLSILKCTICILLYRSLDSPSRMHRFSLVSVRHACSALVCRFIFTTVLWIQACICNRMNQNRLFFCCLFSKLWEDDDSRATCTTIFHVFFL